MKNEIIAKYPHLIQQSEFSGRGQCVTANIRKHLKKLFPSVKFSVTNKSSIRVSWIDGPTESNVRMELSIFDYSDFDAMTDYHGIKSTDFTNMFDGAQFIFVDQELSDEYKEKILDRLNDSRHGGNSITLENMNNHDFSNYFDGEDDCDSYSRHFWDDFREVCAAVSGGYLTEREIQKNITLENFDCGVIHEALKVEIPLFYLVRYVYMTQEELKTSIEEIEEEKQRILQLIDDEVCKRESRETKQEKEEREYNEQVAENNKKLDNINPVQVELLAQHIDIQVKMPALNKNNDLEENKKELEKENYTQTYELYKIVTLSCEDYKLAGENLMADLEIWSDNYPENYFVNEQKTIAHFPVIQVINQKSGESFIVDTQGFKYARYVGQVVEQEQDEVKEINWHKVNKEQLLNSYDRLSRVLTNYHACVGYKELEYNLKSIKNYSSELKSLSESNELTPGAKKELIVVQRLINNSEKTIKCSEKRIQELKIKEQKEQQEQEETGNQFANVADFIAFKNKNTVNKAINNSVLH